MKGKFKLIIGLFIAIAIIAIIVLLPIAMDWLIIGNNIPSNVSNSDWVGFFSGYIGALIGAVVSLAGIIITIRYTNEQNRIDRELQIRPYCSIRYVHDDKLIGTNKILGSLPIGCEPRENNGPRYIGILYLKNIGLGPAIDFSFDLDKINDGRSHYPLILKENFYTYSDLLQPGEEAAFLIYIDFNFDPISESDLINIGNEVQPNYVAKAEIATKYQNFDITIHAKYQDLFHNLYQQNIILSSAMSQKVVKSEKCATQLCDLHLKATTASKKVQKPLGHKRSSTL